MKINALQNSTVRKTLLATPMLATALSLNAAKNEQTNDSFNHNIEHNIQISGIYPEEEQVYRFEIPCENSRELYKCEVQFSGNNSKEINNFVYSFDLPSDNREEVQNKCNIKVAANISQDDISVKIRKDTKGRSIPEGLAILGFIGFSIWAVLNFLKVYHEIPVGTGDFGSIGENIRNHITGFFNPS